MRSSSSSAWAAVPANAQARPTRTRSALFQNRCTIDSELSAIGRQGRRSRAIGGGGRRGGGMRRGRVGGGGGAGRRPRRARGATSSARPTFGRFDSRDRFVEQGGQLFARLRGR